MATIREIIEIVVVSMRDAFLAVTVFVAAMATISMVILVAFSRPHRFD